MNGDSNGIKTRNIIIIIAASVAITLIIFVTAFKFINNAQRYKNAIEYMDEGKYNQAEHIFEGLGGYKDSKEKMAECRSFIRMEESAQRAKDDWEEKLDDEEGEISEDIYQQDEEISEYEEPEIELEPKSDYTEAVGSASNKVKIMYGTSIYKGAGYSTGYAGSVEKTAVYSIIEQRVCNDGYVWGRLKSGRGWVCMGSDERSSYSGSNNNTYQKSVPYTVTVSGGTAIYKGAGYSTGYVSDIGNSGVFTVVEERMCSEGYVWGRLKSGRGWIRLR